MTASRRRSARPGEYYFVLALTAILCFSVVTTWLPSRWPVATSQIGIFLLAIAWIARRLLFRRQLQLTWLLIPIGIATLCGPLQLASHHTVYEFATLSTSLEWLTCFVAFFLAIQLFTRASSTRLFRTIVLWFAFWLSVLSVLQFFSSAGTVFWIFNTGYRLPVLGPFINRDHYLVLVELLLPIAIYKLFRTSHAPMYSFIAGTLYASGIAGASRAGAILTTALVLVMVVIMFRHYALPGPLSKAVLLAAGIALFTMVVGWETVWARLNLPEPFSGRYELNISSLKMISERPLGGFGLGTWTRVYPSFAIRSDRVFMNAAHNDWAQWAVEGGIGLPFLMLVILVWSCLRCRDSPWALGIPTVLIHCCAEFPMQVPALSLWLFVMLGLLAARPDRSAAHLAANRYPKRETSMDRETVPVANNEAESQFESTLDGAEKYQSKVRQS